MVNSSKDEVVSLCYHASGALIRLASPTFFTETKVRSALSKVMLKAGDALFKAPTSPLFVNLLGGNLVVAHTLRFGIQCSPYGSTLQFRSCTADRQAIVAKGVNVSKNVLENAMNLRGEGFDEGS